MSDLIVVVFDNENGAIEMRDALLKNAEGVPGFSGRRCRCHSETGW